MALKSAISVVLLALALGWMQPPSSGLDLTNFDRTVRPQDDLFRAVNGGWLSRTPVPPDRVTYGTYLELADKTDADLRTIVERVALGPGAPAWQCATDCRPVHEPDGSGP